MPVEFSAWQQIGSLVRLKYLLNRRDLVGAPKGRVPWLVWIRLIAMFALAAFFSVRVYARLSLAAATPMGRAGIVSWLTLILGGFLLYHVLAPVNVFRSGRELDLHRLLPLPVDLPTLVAARSAASLLDPEMLFPLLPYLAIAAGLGISFFLIPSSLLIVAFFALAIVLGQTLYAMVEIAYERRWFREVLFGLLLSLAALTIVAVIFSVGNAPEKDIVFEKLRATAITVSQWLPSGWTAYAIGEMSQGNYWAAGGVFLALLGCTGLLVWAGGKGLENLYYRRGYDHVLEKQEGGAASTRLLFLERVLPREATAVFIKEFLVFRRSPWWFLFFVISPFFVLGIALSIPALRSPSVTLLMAFAALGAIETLQGVNLLAAECKALPMLLVLPAPRRSLLMGKNLRVLLAVLIEMVIDFTLYTIIVNRLRYLPAMLLFNLSMDLVALAMVTAVSVLDPQRVRSYEFLPRMTMRMFLACLVGSAIGGIPIGGLIWLVGRFPGLLSIASVLSLAYGLLFYRLGVSLIGSYLERREKEILAALV